MRSRRYERIALWPGAIVLTAFLAGSPAFSHAFLQRANPPVGGTVSGSPSELSITFTEEVEPFFSSIEIRDSHNTRLDVGKPQAAPSDARKLIVHLPKLQPGTYTVVWHVTSVDTHKTEGRFDFTVAP
jgi:copper resistance protein C